MDPAPNAAPWSPVGPPAAVVRYRPWVRFGAGAVMAVILVGIVIAVVNAVAAGDPGKPFVGVHGAGVVIGWIVVVVIGGLLVLALGQLALFRVELWPDGYVARAYVRRYVLGLGQLVSIDVRPGRQNIRNPVQATPVLAISARDAAGRRRGFLLTASYQQIDRALPLVDEWVRRRPDLVGPRARPTFVARGSLPA